MGGTDRDDSSGHDEAPDRDKASGRDEAPDPDGWHDTDGGTLARL